MILLIDNYDSFVHNLARYFRRLGFDTRTIRNDRLRIDEIRALQPQAIIISPGPCTPNEAGIALDAVRALAGVFPMLGVCLGHQVIVQALGGEIIRAREPVHGRASWIYHDESPLFAGIESPFSACRYHSLIARRESLPSCLRVTAWTDDQTIMAVQHVSLPMVGVQFHPESVLTGHGLTLLSNFLRHCGLTSSCGAAR
jgi:anthranilate synthase/aminodeoxychorismate synthase-like glutamine amidotransferase